jgi:hypothetical protein
VLSTTLQRCLGALEKAAHVADFPLARTQRALNGLHRVARALTLGVAGLVVSSFVALSVLSSQQNAMAGSDIAVIRQPREMKPAPAPEVEAEPASISETGLPDIGDAGAQTGLSLEQREKAASIIAIGEERGVPPRGWVIALATAMQESKLLMYANSSVPGSLTLPHEAVGSDHDSVGLFQQRPNWGTIAERMDVTTSAHLFYDELSEVPGWQHLPLTVAAQDVQVSAFPDAYAKWEPLATDLVDSLAPVVGAETVPPEPDVQDVQASEPEPDPQPAPEPDHEPDEEAETAADPDATPLDRLLVLREDVRRVTDDLIDGPF